MPAHEIARLVGRLRQRILLRLVAHRAPRASAIFFCSASRFARDVVFHPARGLRRWRPAARSASSGSSRGCACRGCCRRLRRACATRPSRRAASRWRASRAAAAGRRPWRPSRPCAGRAPAPSPGAPRQLPPGRGRSRRTRRPSVRRRAPAPSAARPGCRARSARPGSARASAARRAACRAPRWPARRRPACRWPPPAASRSAASCSCFGRVRRGPAAAARARAARAGAPLPRLPARAAAGCRRRRPTAAAAGRPAPAGADARLPAAAAAPAPSASPRADRPAGRSACCSALLLHLVLVRQLVELELEEVGEVVGHRALLAAAATPPPPPCCCATCVSYCCSASCRIFSARCSGASASSGFIAFRSASASFISAAAFGSASGDLVEGPDRRRRAAPSACRRALPPARAASPARGSGRRRSRGTCPAFVFALSRTVLNVAATISRCCRESSPTSPCWPPPPPPPRLRLRLLVVLLERPDLHEVDVARRRLRTRDRVVVGRLRVVGHEVARLQARALRGRSCGRRSLR